jgi:hypothetical protein
MARRGEMMIDKERQRRFAYLQETRRENEAAIEARKNQVGDAYLKSDLDPMALAIALDNESRRMNGDMPWRKCRGGAYDESKHPRDEQGRWTEGGGDGGASGGTAGTKSETFTKDSAVPHELNDIPFAPYPEPDDWNAVDGQKELNEPPLKVPEGSKPKSGLITFEKDGRVWLTEPVFGRTIPASDQGEGLSLQANAIRQHWRATGIKSNIVGHVGDFDGTRYYLAHRADGTPTDVGSDITAVHLMPPKEASEKLSATQKVVLAAAAALFGFLLARFLLAIAAHIAGTRKPRREHSFTTYTIIARQPSERDMNLHLRRMLEGLVEDRIEQERERTVEIMAEVVAAERQRAIDVLGEVIARERRTAAQERKADAADLNDETKRLRLELAELQNVVRELRALVRSNDARVVDADLLNARRVN